MRSSLAPVLLLALAACENPVSYGGVQMRPYFPFDGARTWEFVSSDTSIGYRLLGTLEAETTTGHDGDVEIFTVAYSRKCPQSAVDCTEDWIRDVRWSAHSYHGIEIWGYESPSGSVVYNPPLKFALGEMLGGDQTTTTTGGSVWTSTFEGLATCPVTWTAEWGDRCARYTLETDGTDTLLAGEWYAITQYNVVAFQLTSDTGIWQLDYATVEN